MPRPEPSAPQGAGCSWQFFRVTTAKAKGFYLPGTGPYDAVLHGLGRPGEYLHGCVDVPCLRVAYTCRSQHRPWQASPPQRQHQR